MELHLMRFCEDTFLIDRIVKLSVQTNTSTQAFSILSEKGLLMFCSRSNQSISHKTYFSLLFVILSESIWTDFSER